MSSAHGSVEGDSIARRTRSRRAAVAAEAPEPRSSIAQRVIANRRQSSAAAAGRAGQVRGAVEQQTGRGSRKRVKTSDGKSGKVDPRRRAGSVRRSYDRPDPNGLSLSLLPMLFEQDELVYSMMSYLVAGRGATSFAESRLFVPLLRVCRSWCSIFSTIRSQMRHDYLNKMLQDFVSGQYTTKTSGILLKILYLPPRKLLNGDVLEFSGISANFLKGVLDADPLSIPPEGILYVTRSNTWDEIQELFDEMRGREQSQPHVGKEMMCSYVPPCVLPSLNVSNEIVLDDEGRLIRFRNVDGGGSIAEEYVGHDEFKPVNRYQIQSASRAETDEENRAYFLWFKFYHVMGNDKCTQLIRSELLPALGPRPPRREDNVPFYYQSHRTHVDSAIAFVFPFSALSREIQFASVGLHELRGRDIISIGAGRSGWLATGIADRLCPEYLNDCLQKSRSSIGTAVIRGEDIEDMSQGQEMSSSMMSLFMQW